MGESDPPTRLYLEMAVCMVAGFLVLGGLTALMRSLFATSDSRPLTAEQLVQGRMSTRLRVT